MDIREKLDALIIAKEHYRNILMNTTLMLKFAELINTADLLTATLVCKHQFDKLDLKAKALEERLKKELTSKA